MDELRSFHIFKAARVPAVRREDKNKVYGQRYVKRDLRTHAKRVDPDQPLRL